MRSEYYYDSLGGGVIRACRWTPEGEVRAIVQIVHGIAEHVSRYDDFAKFLNRQGILVVAADHMGHGKSVCEKTPKGCISGGWMSMVKDAYRLTRDTIEEFPGVPFVLFGHSMGSFVARTMLAKFPDSGIRAAIICGSAWMPEAVVSAGKTASGMICKLKGENHYSTLLQKMMFGGYDKRIDHPRTKSDWLSRDNRIVDAYEADPLCGFIPSAGLVNAMMEGILYIQKKENMERMEKNLPVWFIAGGDDPVGAYGDGVRKAAEEFKKCGMEHVDVRIYPLCRHEILNELNRQEVYDHIAEWIGNFI